jgi:hypothetical protein
MFGVLVDGGVTVDELQGNSEGGGRLRQEAELPPEGDWRDCDFFLSALAFYGFQSIARVEEYESGFGVLFGTQIKGKN